MTEENKAAGPCGDVKKRKKDYANSGMVGFGYFVAFIGNFLDGSSRFLKGTCLAGISDLLSVGFSQTVENNHKIFHPYN